MRPVAARLFAALLVGLGSACEAPPPGDDACPAPSQPPPVERIVVDDCADIVDVAALPEPPDPPPCPAPADPAPPLCPDGGSAEGGTATTQAELEAWRGCSRITSRLTVTGDVCSLSPLASVEEVRGLSISGEDPSSGPGIVDLDGLQALRVVDGSFELRALPALAFVDGLDALEEVTQDFELSQLPSLARLTGPPALRTVGGNVGASFADALVLVDGFDSLESVGANLDVRASSGVVLGHDPALRCVTASPLSRARAASRSTTARSRRSRGSPTRSPRRRRH